MVIAGKPKDFFGFLRATKACKIVTLSCWRLGKPRPGFLLEIIFFFHVQFVGGVFGHHLTPSILPLGPSTSAISTFSWTSSASSTGSSSNISPYSAQVMYGQERPYRDQRRQQSLRYSNRLTISRIQDSEMTITDLNRLNIWLDGLIEYHRIKSCNALCSCWDSQVSSCTVPEADCHNHYSISCQMLVDSHTTLWMLWSLPIFAPNWNMIGWGWERAPSKWMKNLKLARQKNREAYSFYLGLQSKLLKPQTFRRTGGHSIQLGWRQDCYIWFTQIRQIQANHPNGDEWSSPCLCHRHHCFAAEVTPPLEQHWPKIAILDATAPFPFVSHSMCLKNLYRGFQALRSSVVSMITVLLHDHHRCKGEDQQAIKKKSRKQAKHNLH